MKIKAEKRFKEDYIRLEKRVKDLVTFRKALNRAITLLQMGKDISNSFTVNRLTKRGEGWYDCYITDDIVMIYMIQGQSVKLTAIGPVEEMYDR
ncbi:MAG: type II toxin-antitoxin system mRNA interferase toxin, RelE/StbE family [Chitinivibrionales bacterium]|nr:type II toxin-antitoxin system mRNA interferase toxin, RelE/StbE family [Chitinivibrionales bacterium]